MAEPAARTSTPRPTPVPHQLSDVVALVGAEAADDPAGVVVTGVAQDSRSVVAGDLYVARPGAKGHGAAFARQAAEAGAVAALTDPAGLENCRAAGLTTLVVPLPQAVLGTVSAWAYDHPARDLVLFGVTGTNGKTTTTFLLDTALRHAGYTTGQLGTVGTRIGDETLRSVRTTPEAPDLQAILAVMRERGVSHVSMEVSSHALTFGRVDGTVFDVVGFTNLSQDHLELHGDMESYFAAKAALFGPDRARVGVVNVDDPYGARLARQASIDVTTFSLARDTRADWRVTPPVYAPDGVSEFRLLGPDGFECPVTLGLLGDFNVANAVLAAAMLARAGIDPRDVLPAFATANFPGRMERVPGSTDVVVIVDYAHTPDAIALALRSVRPWTKRRVVAVLGCGGDRDQAKRPLMGAAAARHADLTVVTDDNPRSEDPAEIRTAALRGARDVPDDERGEVLEIAGRRAAIRSALSAAGPGDTVLVLGKGHEQGQEVAGVVHPFDDRVVVQEVLQEMSDAHEAMEQKGPSR